MRNNVVYSQLAVSLLLLSSCALSAPVRAENAPVTVTLTLREDANDRLRKAIQKGDVEGVTAALAEGANVNAPDGKSQRTPLMEAARLGRTDLVRLLLEKGADTNLRDKDGKTALHHVLGAAEPQKKRNGGLGSYLNKAKDIGLRAVQTVGQLGPVASFIPGGVLLQGMASTMMSSVGPGGLAGLVAKGNLRLDRPDAWSGMLGTAMLGKGANTSGLLGDVSAVIRPGSAADPRVWSNLLTTMNQSANGADIKAILNGFSASLTADERSVWDTYLKAVETKDEATLARLAQDPTLLSLLTRASTGLRAASERLPALDGGAEIASLLLARGADLSVTDKSGETALTRAQRLNLTTVVPLLTRQ